MVYSTWAIEQNILKSVILGHFLPFYPPKNPKYQNFEKWKNLLEISSFYTCTKNHNHMMYSSWDTEFLSFWAIFCLFSTTPSDPKNQNFDKKMKKMPWDIILLYIHLYHKWRSYDIWFLKNKVRQIEIFFIMGHFLPFHSPDNLENQKFKIEKNTWRYYHFTHVYHKWQSYDAWFLRYQAWWTEF